MLYKAVLSNCLVYVIIFILPSRAIQKEVLSLTGYFPGDGRVGQPWRLEKLSVITDLEQAVPLAQGESQSHWFAVAQPCTLGIDEYGEPSLSPDGFHGFNQL